jgi:hypothetical protein
MRSMGNLKSRFEKLEGGSGKRTFVMWDKSPFDPTFDLEADEEKFCRERGVTTQDTLVKVSWFSPKEEPGHAPRHRETDSAA